MSFSNEYTLNLDIKKRMSNVVPIFRQGDTAKLNFRAYDNGRLFDLSTYTRSEIAFTLPSGRTLVNDCTLENGIISYEFFGVEMSEVGNVSVIVSIYSNETVVSVQPFRIHIYDNMRGQDLSYIKILQDLMGETQLLKAELSPLIAEVRGLKDDLNELSVYMEEREIERDEAESERIDSEDERIFNENERIQEEGQREDNETIRANNETTRISKETQRVNVEAARVNAESTRVSNESNRVITEGLRVSAENARNTSETNRVTKENDRVAKETQRVNAETVRVSNETTRGNNEQSRSQAETLRSQNETTRTNAENIRKTNEITREQNELLRQETLSEMTEIVDNFDLRGQYSNSITYEKFNTVTYNGSSYMALKTVTGIVPTDDGVNWQLLAQRGVDGDGSVSSVNGIMPDTNGNVVIPATEAIDRLDSTSTTNALSANKGRELKEMLDNIEFDASDVIVTSETEPTSQSENYLWFDVSDTAFDSIDIENAVVSTTPPTDLSLLWLDESTEGNITLKKNINGVWKTLNPKTSLNQVIEMISGKTLDILLNELKGQIDSVGDIIVDDFNQHVDDMDIHVTQAEKEQFLALRAGNGIMSSGSNPNKNPDWYYALGRQTYWENLREIAIGIPDAGENDWCASNVLIPYTDPLEDKLTQVAYTSRGIYVRPSVGDYIGSTSWGMWEKLATSTELTQHLAQTTAWQKYKLTKDNGMSKSLSDLTTVPTKMADLPPGQYYITGTESNNFTDNIEAGVGKVVKVVQASSALKQLTLEVNNSTAPKFYKRNIFNANDSGWIKQLNQNDYNELFQSVSNGKAQLATAITGKGISTVADATFATMASNIGLISTGKKWATQTFANSTTLSSFPGYYGINLTSLPFVPSMIFIVFKSASNDFFTANWINGTASYYHSNGTETTPTIYEKFRIIKSAITSGTNMSVPILNYNATEITCYIFE